MVLQIVLWALLTKKVLIYRRELKCCFEQFFKAMFLQNARVGIKLAVGIFKYFLKKVHVFSICRQKRNPKVKKKLWESGHNPHQALRYITSLSHSLIRLYNCAFHYQAKQGSSQSRPYLWHCKKIKKQAYTPHM